MNGDRKTVGKLGEKVAADFLRRKGFSIIEMNHRRPWGEIDIIAKGGGMIHFVEVKSFSVKSLRDVSRENKWYRPEEQVHEAKLKKIVRTADVYMNSLPDMEYQIDVVGVFLVLDKRIARCRYFEQVL